jgi:hypothetical protein
MGSTEHPTRAEIERELVEWQALKRAGYKCQRTIHALRWVLGLEPRSPSFELHNPPRREMPKCPRCNGEGVVWWSGMPQPCDCGS